MTDTNTSVESICSTLIQLSTYSDIDFTSTTEFRIDCVEFDRLHNRYRPHDCFKVPKYTQNGYNGTKMRSKYFPLSKCRTSVVVPTRNRLLPNSRPSVFKPAPKHPRVVQCALFYVQARAVKPKKTRTENKYAIIPDVTSKPY